MKNFIKQVENNRQFILNAEKYLWSIPEPGYKEFKTNEYMITEFEKLGYEVTKPDGVTGFSAIIDTIKCLPLGVAFA